MKNLRLKIKSSQVYQEEELIKGCVEGNSICRQILYERFMPKMLGICLRYASGREQAKDMVHEGFIRIFLNIGKFRRESSLETWMSRIMVNCALDAIRKESHNVLYRSVELNENNDDDDQEGGSLPGYDTIENEDEVNSEEIIELMQQLPAGYRTVLNLYALEQMSHKDIAQKLGISEGTSKSQLAKARAYLKKMLDKKKLVTHER